MGKEILIIRLSSIGDIVHCTPVARSLKAAWPDCRITWLVGETAAALLKYNPDIDEVIIWSRERFEMYLRQFAFRQAFALWHQLQAAFATRKFDILLDIHGLFLTGMIAGQIKADRRIGLRGAKELNPLFMTETAPPLGKHVVDRYLGVLSPLGITHVNRRMTVALSEECRETVQGMLEDAGIFPRDKFIVLSPGTSWPAKNWPAVSSAGQPIK